MSADPALADVVGDAFFACDTPQEYYDICTRCAATLYAQGWDSVCGDSGGLATTDEIVNQKTRDAIKELRRCGVLPQGWLAWMVAAALRYAVTAFLQMMIREWLTHNEAC